VARPKLGTHKIPTVERILEAAERAFGTLGRERATLADIAAEAGIRRPSLLYHFETKDALYEAVIRRVFDALKTTLLEEMKPAPFEEQVFNLSSAFMQFLKKRPAFGALILRDMIDGKGPSHDILSNEIEPTLSFVEHWLTTEGKGQVSPEFPIRAALLQLCVSSMLFSSAGKLQDTLWKGDPEMHWLSQQLFLGTFTK
jgi:AcrR family transcriptional regulator